MKNINTHRNNNFHNSKQSTKDITHLRRAGAADTDKVLFTEHTRFK
jgi:hypothetical protein